MSAATEEWLVVVDMQVVFAVPESPWFSQSFAAAHARIGALVPLFEDRTIFTRFIPPRRLAGSWNAYYRKWEFASERVRDDELWRLVDPWRDRPSVDTHRFSKWGDKLQGLTGRTPTLVLCGVSTDCCVMATALAAVDAGAFVRVVADACGAKSGVIHENALSLLVCRAPQLTITTVAEELARLASHEDRGRGHAGRSAVSSPVRK